MQAFLQLGGRLRPLKNHVAGNQASDEHQHEYGFSRMVLAVFLGNIITRGPEDASSNHAHHAGQKYGCSCYILQHIVYLSGHSTQTWQNESIFESKNDQSDGTKRQDHEPCKQDDVKHPRHHVPGLAVLGKGEFEHVRQPVRDIVQTGIGFGTDQRSDPLGDDVGKARHPNNQNND